MLLWTRRPPHDGAAAKRLTAEVAEDPDFKRVVASSTTAIDAENDWTCRVLAAGLKPARAYWYRFTDEHGHGSRVGRTKTAPAAGDARAVRFTFVSCQNVCQGAQNAYRRMLYEDARRPEAEQLDFVLHLGDFIYELVWYPEDRPQGMYDRRLRDLVRFRDGEKVQDFHIAASLDDYRALYRAYLQDPDLQDARARWPFVCVWDNHEFSWRGWQSFLNVGTPRPAQTLKVAANRAWFEFQPARVVKQGGAAIERFEAPDVRDAPITRHDEDGLGLEPNNLAAVNSLIVYRRLRFGRNVDLVLTDQHRSSRRMRWTLLTRRRSRARSFPSHAGRGRRDLRRGPRVQRLEAARDDPLRRAGVAECSQGLAAADDARRRTEALVPRAAARIRGDLEDLG